MADQPEMTKEAFLGLVKHLDLPGNEERFDALYEDVKTALLRSAAVHNVDTTGVEPSPINPWFDVSAVGEDPRGGEA